MADHHFQMRPLSKNFVQLDIFPIADGVFEPVQRISKSALFKHRGGAAQTVQRCDRVGLRSAGYKRLYPGQPLGKRHHKLQKALIAQSRAQPIQCHQLRSPE
jgi:hypothetical protein